MACFTYRYPTSYGLLLVILNEYDECGLKQPKYHIILS